MIQVIVKNLQNEVVASAKFQSLELAEQWVTEQTANQSVCLWGNLARTEEVLVGINEETGEQIFEQIDYPQEFTVEYIDLGDEHAWQEIREKRNNLLQECDWTQLADSPLSEQVKAQYVVYRQLLRDITEAISPEEVIWPIKP